MNESLTYNSYISIICLLLGVLQEADIVRWDSDADVVVTRVTSIFPMHFSYQTLLSVFFLFFSFLFFFYYCAFLDQESYQQQMQLQQRCVVRDVSFYSFCLVLSWEVYYHILIYHIRISGRKNISNYGRYHFRTISVFPSVLDSSDSLSRRHSYRN